QELFAIPRMPFEFSDHLIGLHASQLPVDDGTLQIGIGALAEALSYSLILRHERNDLYRQLLGRLHSNPMGPPISHEPFRAGLYGMSEMVMDSFMHLRIAGILTREVQNKKSPHPRYLHGGFFLGSKPFYAWLKGLSEKDRRGISMTRISKINDLYDEDEAAVRAQRKNARFFNSTMQVSLLGEALSDTLQDGRVISGVGGQYNFVAMSRELPDAYSTLLLRSTWHDGKRRRSNIVMHGGHVTIPRHLRDIVITEYGIANLRGKTDQECVQALIGIADAEFQDELLAQAKKALKVSATWRIPEIARRNTPANLREFLAQARALDAGLYPDYPFGSDFTPVEQRILPALAKLKSAGRWAKLALMARGLRAGPFAEEMARMELKQPNSFEARLNKLALMGALAAER
ncbi:MAG: acetyl-CoA hydrolase, partial [Proteobacteria bacterium]